jgi:hypothetical protein
MSDTELDRASYMKTIRFTVFVGAITMLLSCLVLQGSSQAQGFDVSQLLGGVGLGGHPGQAQANAAVTVERNVAPYTGTFSGKESTGAETKSLDAKFACYPAQDPAFDKTDAFVCYAAQ